MLGHPEEQGDGGGILEEGPILHMVGKHSLNEEIANRVHAGEAEKHRERYEARPAIGK